MAENPAEVTPIWAELWREMWPAVPPYPGADEWPGCWLPVSEPENPPRQLFSNPSG